MMLRYFKLKLNWKYILGELLLIFTGITLATWFNSNLSERNKREEEKHIVGVILTDLKEDLAALDFDIMILNGELGRLEKLNAWCGDTQHSIPFDSVKVGLMAMTKEEWKDINSNGYNLLLHHDAELLQNETVRGKVLFYYSQLKEAVSKQETSGNMTVGENLKYISEHFKSFDFGYAKTTEPIDSNALQMDYKLKIMVQDFISRRDNNLAVYKDFLRPKLTELIALIEKEYAKGK
jgi:hypothetical protein